MLNERVENFRFKKKKDPDSLETQNKCHYRFGSRRRKIRWVRQVAEVESLLKETQVLENLGEWNC